MKWLEHRVPPPLVTLLIGAAMWVVAPGGDAPGWRLGLAALLAAAGVAFAVGGVVSFNRARTTVNPLKPETASALVTGGIYRLTRNPMYVGMLLVLAGWAAWLYSAWALVGLPAFILYIGHFQIAPEERALQALFGESFTAYCARVRRWL